MFMSEAHNNHKSIVKATGVFGFLQIFKMLMTLIGNKFIALFIGPVGIGLVSLLNSTVNVIFAVTNFEFLKTATREIALKNDINNQKNLTQTISLLQKIALLIGVLSGIISIVFCNVLSKLTFSDTSKSHWFVLLSAYFFITSISNARLAILQGINNIKKLALLNIMATFFTIIASLFIYYYLKTEGIVWVMLSSSCIMFFVTLFFTRDYPLNITFGSFSKFYEQATPIVKLGFILSINLILGQVCNLLIKYYLSNSSNSFQTIGFYEVSSVIMINYLGLIFNAMSYDFFPKLASVSSQNEKSNLLVNHQIEIAIILVTPAILFLYLFGTPIIELLYSKEFLSSFAILKLALFSIIVKAIALPFGYLILAKGNKKQYFKQELLSDFLNLFLTVVFYYQWGLTGVGLAYVINYVVYTVYLYQVIKKEYEFYFLKSSISLIYINIFFGISAIITTYSFTGILKNVILSLLLLASVYYSFIQLDKRINILKFFNKN